MVDEIYDLKDWTILSIQKVLEENIVATIHIDELMGYVQPKLSIKHLIDIIEEMSLILEQLSTSSLSIYMSIDLLPKSVNPLKFIGDISWIEQELLPRAMPEIVIYRPSNPEFIPLVELHRMPLDKDFFGLKGNFNPFYKENRSISDIKNRVKLSRELLFIYYKNGGL